MGVLSLFSLPANILEKFYYETQIISKNKSHYFILTFRLTINPPTKPITEPTTKKYIVENSILGISIQRKP